MYTIQTLVEKVENSSISALIKTNHIYVIPVLNADSYHALSEFWSVSKTPRTKNFSKSTCQTDDQKSGVRLNNNFEVQWGADDLGSSSDPCSKQYRGEKAGSEPEVRGLSELAR